MSTGSRNGPHHWIKAGPMILTLLPCHTKGYEISPEATGVGCLPNTLSTSPPLKGSCSCKVPIDAQDHLQRVHNQSLPTDPLNTWQHNITLPDSMGAPASTLSHALAVPESICEAITNPQRKYFRPLGATIIAPVCFPQLPPSTWSQTQQRPHFTQWERKFRWQLLNHCGFVLALQLLASMFSPTQRKRGLRHSTSFLPLSPLTAHCQATPWTSAPLF